MSHVVEISVVIRDLAALEAAASRLGLSMIHDKKTYKWFGSFQNDYPLPPGFTADQLGKCDHVLKLDGNRRACEVGVVAKPDGTYGLLFDFWEGGYGLQDAIGQNGEELLREYGLEAAQRAAQARGWITERTGMELLIYADGGVLRVDGRSIDALNFMGDACALASNPIAIAMGLQTSEFLKAEAGAHVVQAQVLE